MEFLTDLWLPVIASAGGVFVVSSILHMFLPIHKGDYRKLPQEETVLASMRDAGLSRGAYMFPACGSMKDMGTPEMVEKFNRGPVGFMTLYDNGPMNMGKSLLHWFLYTVLIGVAIAYLAHGRLEAGAEFMAVFPFVAVGGLLGYSLPAIQDSIWKGQLWGVTGKFIFDGLVYALTTGAIFGWLWPAAV